MKSKTKKREPKSPSLAHAAGVLGVPRSRLQDALRAGVGWIDDHNRVSIPAAQAWLKRHPAHKAKGTHQLRETKLMQEIRKLRIQNDAKERTLIPKQLVIDAHTAFLRTFLPAIRKLLVDVSPSQIYGLGVPDIRIALKGVTDDIYTEASKGAEHFRGF